MALMDLSERPAQAVRLGEQEDIKASQDQIWMARFHDLEMKREKGNLKDYEDRVDTTRGIPLEDLNLSKVGAVKELDKWLTANQLNTSDPMAVIIYVKKLTTWM